MRVREGNRKAEIRGQCATVPLSADEKSSWPGVIGYRYQMSWKRDENIVNALVSLSYPSRIFDSFAFMMMEISVRLEKL